MLKRVDKGPQNIMSSFEDPSTKFELDKNIFDSHSGNNSIVKYL